ncbi:helix-turn-helix domain-containing protein [Microbacterium halotolerans]|uniref:helix-turn-helix domain-containing protein n=1 Tax=Microbacterium halotolerans TaxID=246613 RepID=UPI000E6AB94A|nr:helix-turn-helix transcriptional regulator [Microbacterium halotolerans]
MNIRGRAGIFSRLVGWELKGRIVARGFTAKAVAERARRSPSALSNWLNGHVELPLAALFEACEIIGIEPGDVVDAAYDRLRADLDCRSSALDEGVGARGTATPLTSDGGERHSTEMDSAE